MRYLIYNQLGLEPITLRMNDDFPWLCCGKSIKLKKNISTNGNRMSYKVKKFSQCNGEKVTFILDF